MEIPKIGDSLTNEHIKFLETFSKSCRHSILQMVVNSQSGHPGGALSSIDYLSTVYGYILSRTGEKIVISNGHISPGVYATLGEMGYIDKEDVVANFRKAGKIYEGHITRHVDGVWYGTGPLGVGVSVAAAFAHAEKMRKTDQKVFGLLGDGEAQEGQVHEMIHYARKYKLNNLILFVDYNQVQLTASLKETMEIDLRGVFEGGHWHVIDVDGHDYQAIWNALGEAYGVIDRPVVIIGHTIMGKGVPFMEPAGADYKSDWHGKAPKPEEVEKDLEMLSCSEEETAVLDNFRKNNVKWKPKKAKYPKLLSEVKIDTGDPILYKTEEITDCRSAYGQALLDLAKRNKKIIALTADLKGSVMTKFVSAELPDQYIEVGIAEQHMVSAAGGFSLDDYIPFASTFGAFMTSRAKDQARVNDINCCNVKMVSTHCGLSVGEDGPTHQAIDDMGSFLGFFNTMIIEPADPNQTDRIIRYVASHYGNFYVRMGRHKFPVILKKDGTPFYDKDYKYEYGKCDIIREGKDVTIAASGALVTEALKAIDILKEKGKKISIELVAVSSIKKFDKTLLDSIKKTGKVITAEDHNTFSGLGAELARELAKEGIKHKKFEMIGVEKYELSGKPEQLYKNAGIDGESIAKTILKI